MVLVASAAATAVRYGLIERDEVAPVRDALSAPWWCMLRLLVIQGFLNDVTVARAWHWPHSHSGAGRPSAPG